MSSPEVPEGWAAQLVYLGAIGVSGLVAWISQFRKGHADEDHASKSAGHHVVLESAEIADMRPMRALSSEMVRIREQLQQTFIVVQDNHRIVEDNHRIVEQNREMLSILQKLDRAFEIEEEVKEQLRRVQMDALLKAREDRPSK